jgi:PAS domain S-box-containing protein
MASQIEHIFEDMVETIREPLLVLDSDLRVLLANRSFYASFKVTPKETIGHHIYDLGNRQWNIPGLRVLLEEIIPKDNEFNDYEVDHTFSSIGHRIMLLNARRVIRKETGSQMILLAMEDITERRQLERSLIEAEQHFRRLFETANDGILLIEKSEGNITHSNPALSAMLGYSKEECIGHKVQDIGFPDDMSDIEEIQHTLHKDGIIRYNDTPLQTKNGQMVDTDIYLVNRARLIQCNIRDVTERKKAEQALEKSRQNLQDAKDQLVQSEKLSAIGLLASGAAHEILNPLNILSLRLQILELKPPEGDDLKEGIKICKNQINRIVKIVAGLRKFSRPSEHKLEEKNIAEIMYNVLGLSAPRIKTEDVTTDVNYDQSVPLLRLDEEAIEQVLFNLVSNALDSIKGREKRILRVSTEKKENKVLITISDTGHGIKEGDLLKLFDPFFTTKGPDRGTGLGLSVSYGIIKNHGGRIWAENNEWGGATFFVELPIGERSGTMN